ncbi:MAG TPA: hypothetical protein ENK38_02080 [Gammaproteobacteria bacterium]|nr:hypothetical protein [Gammaproteobacteria bacterium]
MEYPAAASLLYLVSIAAQCHENNRDYCRSIGDDSQPPWCLAPAWQQTSALEGVIHAINNPYSTPEDSHRSWLEAKVMAGWVYGEVKDPAAKTHPCMLPYDQLPDEQRAKDRIFLDTVRKMVENLPATELAEPVPPPAFLHHQEERQP